MQRTLTEMLVVIAASAVITIGTAVAGARLVASPATEAAPRHGTGMVCMDEPFVSTGGSVVGSVARLCLGDDVVSPRIELTGLTNNALFTAWIAYAERPSAARRERCVVDDAPPHASSAIPWRFDENLSDQTGRLELTSILSGLRFASGSEIQVLVVEHGWLLTARRAAVAGELRTWQQGWTPQGPAATIGDAGVKGWVVGCATFRPLSGGLES